MSVKQATVSWFGNLTDIYHSVSVRNWVPSFKQKNHILLECSLVITWRLHHHHHHLAFKELGHWWPVLA